MHVQPNDPEKRPRHRSPNYPAIGLPEAIDRVRRLYDADKRAGAPIDAALRHIGFTSRHGKALALISALRKFGLVEDSGGRIAPTQRAVTILAYPESDPRRWAALKEAAMSPEVYRSLYDRYVSGGYLPSEETLKAEVEAEMGFNPNAIPDFVKDFKATLVYSGLLDQDTLELASEDKMQVAQSLQAPSETKNREIAAVIEDAAKIPSHRSFIAKSGGHPEASQESGSSQEVLQFKIGEDAEAKILLRGHITQEAIEKLRKLLEVSKDTYPTAGKSSSGHDNQG